LRQDYDALSGSISLREWQHNAALLEELIAVNTGMLVARVEFS
jgi:hypothetical protein